MGVPLVAVEGLVVGFCSTVVFLVDDWMTAPMWREVGCRVLLDSRVLGGRLDDSPDVERGWSSGSARQLCSWWTTG